MKKFLCVFLAALFLLSLAGCGASLKKGEFGGNPVSLMPQYNGEGEDDPYYQFTEEDLTVRVVYDDSTIADMETGFKVTTTTEMGWFEIEVSWNGLTGELLIPIGKEKYQTYKADLEEKRAAIAEEQQAAIDEALAAANAETAAE